jgi:hypothetical protein
VWIVDSYGSSLAKVNPPAWGGQSEVTFSMDITWPKGSNVALQVLWHVNGDVVSDETSYVSGERVVESSNEWPLAAIAWGLMLGGAVSLVLRLRARKSTEPGAERRLSRRNQPSEPPFRTMKNERFPAQNAIDGSVSQSLTQERLDARIAASNFQLKQRSYLHLHLQVRMMMTMMMLNSTNPLKPNPLRKLKSVAPSANRH